MHSSINFYSLLIIASLAFILPILVNKIRFIRIPTVIAEIIAGIIVGKSGFDLVHDDVWLEFLSLLGFSYLMFLSGMEIDLNNFKRSKNKIEGELNPVLLSVVIVILNAALAFFAALLLNYFEFNVNPFFLTLIFISTSLGIVVPTLKEKMILNEPIGQIILFTATIADFVSMLMIPVVVFIINLSGGLSLALSFVLFLFFGGAYFLGKLILKRDYIPNPTYETMQLKVRAAFFFVLIFVSISQAFNVEYILGAFLAGILFSLLFGDFKHELNSKLDAIGYGFLIPIFFIMIGVDFEIDSVLNKQTLIMLPIISISLFFVKIIPALMLKKYFSWRESIGSGVLLASGLSLIIAISLVAYEMGIIDEKTNSIFILYAIVTSLISPMIFLKIFPEYEQKSDAVILTGDQEILAVIAGKIDTSFNKLIIMDSHADIYIQLDTMNIEYTLCHNFDSETLLDLNKKYNIVAFEALYSSNTQNIAACMAASNAGIEHTVAIVDDHNDFLIAKENGIHAISPMLATVTLLTGLVMYPESFEFLYKAGGTHTNITIREIPIHGYAIVGMKLKDIRLPGDCLIMMIVRNGNRLIPDGNTLIKNEDIVVIMGSHAYLEDTIQILTRY